ncbi:MAG: glycosyltransferase family 4 protein [Bacteroidales bacterium]|nr:glycosyltransferase family 4 protein [Bacteroidales bacterium]
MKKVLIITYYWPPSGGAGVQRWLKFVKYLREFGWEPVVYTPENPEPPDVDETLFKDIPENLTVIKKPVWEPYTLYKRLTGKKKDKRVAHGFLKEDGKTNFLEKVSVWIRGNFFIPDARCFWIKPSIRFLTEYLRSNPVDAIVSSGPPHSMHMIALGIKKKLGIPWLADFRDPWTEIDFYNQLMLTDAANRKHKKLEKEVLSAADAVVTIGNNLAESLTKLGASNVKVITNGFDADDFGFLPVEIERSFTITHIGSVNKDRNPEMLWQAMSELCAENEEMNSKLRLRFVGKVDFSLKYSLDSHGLMNRTEIIPYLPHQDALRIAASSAALLLLINQTPNQQSIVTGKIFEYLATGRPILCIGPESGDGSMIIRNVNAGVTCEPNDIQALKDGVVRIYKNFTEGHPGELKDKIGSYNRKYLTMKLSEVLDTITR